MDASWELLLDAGHRLMRMVLDPSQRIFWVFLVSSLVVAAVVSGSVRRGLLRRELWCHRSTWLDLRLLVANTISRALLAAAFVLSAFGLAVSTVGWLTAAVGEAPDLAVPALVVAVVYTLVLFVTWDASRFGLHWLMHRVPVLWELHQVHHSARVLTPLTLYRVHPLESALYTLRGVVVTGLVTGAFFYVFRRSAVELELLGVNALGFLFNLVGGNLRHSHVWWSWGPRLERWLISPAQHQLHHAGLATFRTRNLGTWLAVWDRWSGTLETADGKRTESFGLPAATCNHDPEGLTSALIRPVVAGVGCLRPALPSPPDPDRAPA